MADTQHGDAGIAAHSRLRTNYYYSNGRLDTKASVTSPTEPFQCNTNGMSKRYAPCGLIMPQYQTACSDTTDIVLQIVVAIRSEIALLDVVRLLDQR